MKRLRATLLFSSILITMSIIGVVWYWNRTVSRPPYGKDSLSEEEKRILINSPEDCLESGCWRRAYKVGMICLKHHLSVSEVDGLMPGQITYRHPCNDTGGECVDLMFCPTLCYPLDFEFDAEGKIVRVSHMVGGVSRRLPPLESITPDAPIELPPIPFEGFWVSKATEALLESGAWRERAVTTTPPAFASASYTNAKMAVECILLDTRGQRRHLATEYPLRIIAQLRDKNLTGDKRALAIYLLGKIQPPDTDSISVLIEQIDFKVDVPYNQPEWRQMYHWSEYPARDALIRTGEASIGPIVHDLPGETNELRRHLLCAVLSTFGRTNWTTAWQPKTAIDQLQRMRATEPDAVRQQNLDAALGLLIDNKVDVNIGWAGYFRE